MRSRNYKIYDLVSVKVIIIQSPVECRIKLGCLLFLHCCRQRWSWMLNAYCMESKWTWLAHTSKMQIILSVLVNCAVWNPRKIIIITHAYCDSETKWSQCKIIAQPLGILQYELWANSCSSTVSIVVISVSVYTAIKQWRWGAFAFQ